MSTEAPATCEASSSCAQEDVIKKRIGRYDYYWDSRSFSYKHRKTTKQKQSKNKSAKHAIIVGRVISSKGQHVDTLVEIQSQVLCNVLLEINEGVEGLELSLSQPRTKMRFMFHSLPGLINRLREEQKKETPDEAVIQDVSAAIQVVQEDEAKTLMDYAKLTAKGEMTYSLLWTIFTPNTLVYNFHNYTEQGRILLVRSTKYVERQDGSEYLKVSCDVIHNSGTDFGLTRQHIFIDGFTGVRPITELAVYPLIYHPEKDDVLAQAVEFGKRFVALPRHKYCEIVGHAMRDLPGGEHLEKYYNTGRVMISPFAFHRYQPNSTYNYSVWRTVNKASMTEQDYAICTPVLLGFSFSKKSWGAFAMARMQEVTWNENAFAKLVLGEKQKKLIHGLVRVHTSRVDGFDDIVKGKGRGLIGLLSGTPGCGKTLTAEAVAEVTHKPLYSISAGELGTKADTVEYNLLRATELAHMWDAVMLLDEAEVFLQQRKISDLERNALVAIFLRNLEYYQGIMILTTNMAEQCDMALESRIHFSVHYPELDVAARRCIWKMFFDRASLEITEDQLDHLAKHEINGRQIKNAFSSAQSISIANGSPQLAIEDIDVVLSVLHDWRVASKQNEITTKE